MLNVLRESLILVGVHLLTRQRPPVFLYGHSEQRTPQPARWILVQWSSTGKEAHDEPGGEKENCCRAASEMGEGKAISIAILEFTLKLRKQKVPIVTFM
jgi:hypothetical protein